MSVSRARYHQSHDNDEANQAETTVSIGDTGGNFARYSKYNRLTSLTNSNLEWRGGKRTVVYHGDIFGDRGFDSFKIAEHINSSRGAISNAGGKIFVLDGNHDDYAFSFLTNRQGCHTDGLTSAKKSRPLGKPQGLGLLEFTRFSGDGVMVKDFKTAESNQRLDRQEILSCMRNDRLGRIILDEFTRMLLCHVKGNTLRVHTDPTENMITALLNEGADAINSRYQTAAGEHLIDDKVFKPFDQRINPLIDAFVDTGNRTLLYHLEYGHPFALSAKTLERLKNELGITRIIYGHSVVADCDLDNLVVERHGTQFVSVDLGPTSYLPSAAITSPKELQTAENIMDAHGVKHASRWKRFARTTT